MSVLHNYRWQREARTARRRNLLDVEQLAWMAPVPRLTMQQRRLDAVYDAADRMGVPLIEVWYDRSIGRRVEALAQTLPAEALVLLPGRTDTRWFRRLPATRMCLLRGRLAVGDHQGSAPFPSLIQYVGDRPERFYSVFAPLGIIIAPWDAKS